MLPKRRLDRVEASHFEMRRVGDEKLDDNIIKTQEMLLSEYKNTRIN
jgi:hypothetical protein